MSIWIRMTVGDTLTVEGNAPTSTDITLYPGWNMVGLPSSTSGNHGLPAEVTIVGYFASVEEYNVAYDHSTSEFIFEPGEGYWIFFGCSKNQGITCNSCRYNGADEAVIWTVEY